MKKIIVAALLAITTPVASGAEYGIGLGLTQSNTVYRADESRLNQSGDTIYFPIRTGNYFFEPYISLGNFEDENEYINLYGHVSLSSFESRYRALGAGIFRNWSLSENISVYAGGRIALARYTEYVGIESAPTLSIDYEEHIIAPALGAQYFPHPKFSLGFEHKINHVSAKTDDPPFETDTLDFTHSQTEVTLRIFF